MEKEIKLCLIGFPLAHSLSPAMHTAALQALGLKGSYSLAMIPPPGIQAPNAFASDLPGALARLQREGFLGANVTIPHKETIIPYLKEISGHAAKLRAVNTLIWIDGQYHGFNTDLDGFLADIRRQGFLHEGVKPVSKPPTAVVLGAGGSARAITLCLLEQGYTIILICRNCDKGRTIAVELDAPTLKILPWELQSYEEIPAQTELIVNTTPLGMSPNIEASPWPENLPFPPNSAIYDLIYNPQKTRFIAQAQKQGLRTAGGLGMLVEQGALAFELWTGKPAPRDVMAKAALAAITH